jgi:pantetheine-phosphate adenylyltransferase
MKVAIYPGSFNPIHAGHHNIIEKALKVFDKVIIAQGINPDKGITDVNIPSAETYGKYGKKVQVVKFMTTLPEFAVDKNAVAIIRGLRSGVDLETEKAQQYWYEDLGLTIPIVYFICDRGLTHISSSAVRAVAKSRKT